MRTIPFRDLLDQICLEWKQVVRTDLTAAQLAVVLPKINAAYELAWEYYDWPETLSTTERTPVERVIGHAQAGQEAIHLMVQIYNRDPEAVSDKRPVAVPFHENVDGWVLLRDVNPVWCVYQKQPPQFTLTAFVLGNAHVAGERVFDVAGGGECYRALQAAPANTALTDVAYWEVIPCLAVLRQAVVMGVIGALIDSGGQTQTGAVKISNMSEALDNKILLLTDRSGRVKHIQRSR